ncbi:MAG: FtsX-like permease family protein [Bacillota bacterium]
MNWLMIKNDFVRNKLINTVLLMFIIFSAGLASVSVMMGVQTFSSISNLYSEAQPPHFLQMHRGAIDQEAIDAFMIGREDVTYWQSVEMLNMHGDMIIVENDEGTYDLSDSRLDIGLVKQNEERDLLLDSDHAVVSLDDGEIGIPILLKEQYGIGIGDQVTLEIDDVRMDFEVKEFVLDSQMNSPMVSSTRILVSDGDFDGLKAAGGEKEYLIEAYFASPSESSGFQSAYENAGLPQDGQAVTYSMIFLLSAITDITTVFVLLLVSMLLIMVSFICVKFTIMAALEEEITEIGAMKAIGIPFKDIRSLYLMKYRILALVGVVLGFAIALLSNNLFTSHIQTTFGNMGLSPLAIAGAFLIGLLVYLLITFYCKKVLRTIKKVTVVDSLVRGEGFSRKDRKVRDGLHKSRRLSINWAMALREVFFRFRNWITVFSVVSIAVVMIMIPMNLMNTFDSEEFVTYMGTSLEDVLIEVENGEALESNRDQVFQILEDDEDVEYYHEYRRVRVQTLNADGEAMNLHIDVGMNAGNELQYLEGNAPSSDNEIALSYLNMNETMKAPGDTIALTYDDEEVEFLVSGIYQDVTSGGFTAKATHLFPALESHKYAFSVNLVEGVDVVDKSDEWSALMGSGVSVDPMDAFIDQTLGGVVDQLMAIVSLIVIIGAALVVLITVLFLKLRLVKDYSQIAVLKAIGFSENDLKKQYLIKIGTVTVSGLLLGVLLAGILGEHIVNFVLGFSGLGIRNVALIVNPFTQYALIPTLLLGLVLMATWVVLKTMKHTTIIAIINE